MDKNKTTLFFLLGDREKGWIPNEVHQKALGHLLDEAGLTEKYNCIIYHYGLQIKAIGTEELLKDVRVITVREEEYRDFLNEIEEESKNVSS